MQALLLIGHGSLRNASGAAMIRLAARAREAGIAPIVEAGFLNYSRPLFAAALERCVEKGAAEVVVQPYFLVPGKYVRSDLRRLVQAGRQAQPTLKLSLAQPFGDHPALAQLVVKRAQAAGGVAQDSESALLLIAHGSPNPRANQPIEALAGHIAAQGRYAAVTVSYLDLNAPDIASAIEALVASGLRRIIAVPYFLQLGGHVARDLPQAITQAAQRHSQTTILLAEHLAYDRLLLSVIADRAREALEQA